MKTQQSGIIWMFLVYIYLKKPWERPEQKKLTIYYKSNMSFISFTVKFVLIEIYHLHVVFKLLNVKYENCSYFSIMYKQSRMVPLGNTSSYDDSKLV